MIRKLLRTNDYEVSVQIKNETFIAPPRAAQRNWLLNRLAAEIGYDLTALHEIARRFVPGANAMVAFEDRSQGDLSDDDIMEDWQIPLMRAMAEEAAAVHGDVLEIGFGRGIASDFIQEQGVRSHTIVEVNDSVVQRFHDWRTAYTGRDIRLLHGLWQDKVAEFDLYDGIFYHTYPLNEEEYMEHALGTVTYAETFFPVASQHLRPGGTFSYMTNEIDSLSRAHQRLLLRHFSAFTVRIVPLRVPEDVLDTWYIDQMVIVRATK